MTGGKIITRYFLANAQTFPAEFNLSGGVVELSGSGNGNMGAGNGGTINVSGSVVLDAALATTAIQTFGIVDIAAGWTGTWTYGTHSSDDWKNLFTGNLIEYNGASIDGATFDSTFQVTNGGQTLALIPEPSAFSLAALGLFGLILRRKR